MNQGMVSALLNNVRFSNRPDYWLTAGLTLLVFPLAQASRLSFDFPTPALGPLIAVLLQSLAWATTLQFVAEPYACFSRIAHRDWRRFIVFALMMAVVIHKSGWATGALIAIATFGILEFGYFSNIPKADFLAAFAITTLYFCLGSWLYTRYNDIIVTHRYFGEYDLALTQLDTRLFGFSTIDVSHWAFSHFPPVTYRFLEFVYYGAFAQLGLGILYACKKSGLPGGLRFVGTLLTGYYIALFLLIFFPARGPYFMCEDHVTRFPHWLLTYSVQNDLLNNARALFHHPLTIVSPGGSYVAFPSMHVGQAIIVLWLFRNVHRVRVLLLVFDLCIVAAVILLEWHYLTDVLGGIAVAAAAIYLMSLCPEESSASLGLQTRQAAQALPQRALEL